MQIQLKKIDETLIWEGEAESIKNAVTQALAIDKSLSGADLTGANLTGADLAGADLYDAYLTDANLRDADLTRAFLHDADLTDANLTCADLRGANLYDADLTCANLRGANLRGANLAGADLYDANLHDADLARANLTCADLRGANLRGANLCGANLHDADLAGVYLRGANLAGAEKYRTTDLYMLRDQPGKIRAYKLVNSEFEGIYRGGLTFKIGAKLEISDAVTNEACGCAAGINVASLPWCLREWKPGYRIMLVEFEASDIAAIPIGSDGKFRLHRCEVVGEKDLVELGLVKAEEGEKT